MKSHKLVAFIGVCILLAGLSGCATPSESNMSNPENTHSADDASAIVQGDVNTLPDVEKQELPSMVDERYELLSLVFRLAGREEYGDDDSEYQQTLLSEFEKYREHAAVQFATGLPLGYDAVFSFSVHIEKNEEQFIFLKNIDSLVQDGRWTRQSADEFLKLLNDFYVETDFAAFYQSNTDFYRTQSQIFIENIYSQIDFDWFGAYVDPNNLRCIYSPSNSRQNYAATVNDTIIYCAVSGEGDALVHEYCHSFANGIAHNWYEENPEFKKWCDDTIDPIKLPAYNDGKIIAGEYVTRAYATLYYAQHGYALMPLFRSQKDNGFPYIEEVYGMITPYEKPETSDDKIQSALGVGYEMGNEQTYSIGDREFRWNVLVLSEPLPLGFLQTEVGNIFGSNTGDVLYVEDTGEEQPFLLIDLGETAYQGEDGYRKYCRIPLEP